MFCDLTGATEPRQGRAKRFQTPRDRLDLRGVVLQPCRRRNRRRPKSKGERGEQHHAEHQADDIHEPERLESRAVLQQVGETRCREAGRCYRPDQGTPAADLASVQLSETKNSQGYREERNGIDAVENVVVGGIAVPVIGIGRDATSDVLSEPSDSREQRRSTRDDRHPPVRSLQGRLIAEFPVNRRCHSRGANTVRESWG
jgi:hypothetical protein